MFPKDTKKNYQNYPLKAGQKRQKALKKHSLGHSEAGAQNCPKSTPGGTFWPGPKSTPVNGGRDRKSLLLNMIAPKCRKWPSGFLRKSSVFCESLRFSAVPCAIHMPQFPGDGVNICENWRFSAKICALDSLYVTLGPVVAKWLK